MHSCRQASCHVWRLVLILLCTGLACDTVDSTEQEQVEPIRFCADGIIACQTSADCNLLETGQSCHVETGCCEQTICLRDAHCLSNEKCDVRRGLCRPKELCDPISNIGCADGRQCLYESGKPVCKEVLPLVQRCELYVERRSYLSGETVMMPEIALYDGNGRVVPWRHADVELQVDGVVQEGLKVPSCDNIYGCAFEIVAQVDAVTCSTQLYRFPILDDAQAIVAIHDAETYARILSPTILVHDASGDLKTIEPQHGVVKIDAPETIEALHVSGEGYVRTTLVGPLRRLTEIYVSTDAVVDRQAYMLETDFAASDLVKTPEPKVHFSLTGYAVPAAPLLGAPLHISTTGETYRLGVNGIEIDEASFVLDGVEVAGSQLTGDAVGAALHLPHRVPSKFLWTLGAAVTLDPLTEPSLLSVLSDFSEHASVSAVADVIGRRFKGRLSHGFTSTSELTPYLSPSDRISMQSRFIGEQGKLSIQPLFSIELPTIPDSCDEGPGGEEPICSRPHQMLVTIVPGVGMLPLGFAGRLDEHSEDVATTYFSPPHDGLEGYPQLLVSVDYASGRVQHTAEQAIRRLRTQPLKSYEFQDGHYHVSWAELPTLPPTALTYDVLSQILTMPAPGRVDAARVRVQLGEDVSNVWDVYVNGHVERINLSALKTAWGVSNISPALVSTYRMLAEDAGGTSHPLIQSFPSVYPSHHGVEVMYLYCEDEPSLASRICRIR